MTALLSRRAFNAWFVDFGKRFPSIREYVKNKGEESTLVDTWHKSLLAFTPEILKQVTDGMISGKIDNIDPYQFGVFGSEIRKRCRSILDQQRSASNRETLHNMPSREVPAGKLLNSSKDQYYALLAMVSLTDRAGIPCPITFDRITPKSLAHCAIILAGPHTASEETAAMDTLAMFGIPWETVLQKAAVIKRNGMQLFGGVHDDDEIGEGADDPGD